MNTRHSLTGEFNQERYCSAIEYEGLLANLVAKRCAVLSDPGAIELIFWLQAQSHTPGGIKKLSREFVNHAREKIGSESMLKYGCSPGQIYTLEQCLQVRKEIESDGGMNLAGVLGNDPDYYIGEFPLKGDERYQRGEYGTWEVASVRKGPTSYPAEQFKKYCLNSLEEHVTEILTDYCLNPGAKIPSFAWWPKLAECLAEFKCSEESKDSSEFVHTSISQIIFAELRFASRGGFVYLEGLEQLGKSIAAREWCQKNSGKARYIKVPVGSDDISFFRAIAQAIGISQALSLKGVQMRERIEYVIRTSKLMCVFDSATNLWPQNNRKEALPNRLNWIMSALVEQGAPVALLATPDFTQDGKIVARKTLWRSERFHRLLTHYKPLPETLTDQDMGAITQCLLPEISQRGVTAIVEYARTSAKYVSAIRCIIQRAKFIAEENGRSEVRDPDIKSAIKEQVIPSDNALAKALHEPGNRASRGRQIVSEAARAGYDPTEPVARKNLPLEEGIKTRGTDPIELGLKPLAEV